MERKTGLGLQFTLMGVICFQLLDLLNAFGFLFVLGSILSLFGTIVVFSGQFVQNG
jgi:hypothetical protein